MTPNLSIIHVLIRRVNQNRDNTQTLGQTQKDLERRASTVHSEEIKL